MTLKKYFMFSGFKKLVRRSISESVVCGGRQYESGRFILYTNIYIYNQIS